MNDHVKSENELGRELLLIALDALLFEMKNQDAGPVLTTAFGQVAEAYVDHQRRSFHLAAGHAIPADRALFSIAHPDDNIVKAYRAVRLYVQSWHAKRDDLDSIVREAYLQEANAFINATHEGE